MEKEKSEDGRRAGKRERVKKKPKDNDDDIREEKKRIKYT